MQTMSVIHGELNYNKKVEPSSGIAYASDPLQTAFTDSINSAQTFTLNLSALLRDLLELERASKNKELKKHIAVVEASLISALNYEDRLEKMHSELKKSELGAKSIPYNSSQEKILNTSASAMNACDDFIIKTIKLSEALAKTIEASGGQEKAKLETSLKEVSLIRKYLLKIKIYLTQVHWAYVNGVKNINSGKNLTSTDKGLLEEIQNIHNYTKQIDGNLTALLSILKQYGEEKNEDVSADMLYVNSLSWDVSYFRGEVEKIYKEFGTIRPPVDIIDEEKTGAKNAGGKTVYDNTTFINNYVIKVKHDAENLKIALDNLKFRLGNILTDSQLNLNKESRIKYISVFKTVDSLSKYIQNNVLLKISALEEKYKQIESAPAR